MDATARNCHPVKHPSLRAHPRQSAAQDTIDCGRTGWIPLEGFQWRAGGIMVMVLYPIQPYPEANCYLQNCATLLCHPF